MATTAESLAALTATVNMFMAESRAAAAKGESGQVAMMAAISALTQGQLELASDMADVKPVTDMVTSLRARMFGAMIVLGVIGAVAWAGVQFFKDAIIHFLGA